ncbi:plasmid mobilization protein [Mycobacteroides abscessus]|uniref:plasmid mobilization protein n=1 Tax=Mycobacteroides abscessus TaxID=36809 RepID=UPI00373FD6E0
MKDAYRYQSGQRTHTMSFAVSTEEKAWLQEQARRRGVSVAQLLRDDTLDEYIFDRTMRELQARLAAEAARRAAQEAKQAGDRARESTRRYPGVGADFRFAGPAAAEDWIRTFANAEPEEPTRKVLRRAYRRAHPDAGGHPNDWNKVDQARRLLLPSRS